MRTIKRKTEALLVTSKEKGVEVNTEKTMYMLTPCMRQHNKITTHRQVINPSEFWQSHIFGKKP